MSFEYEFLTHSIVHRVIYLVFKSHIRKNIFFSFSLLFIVIVWDHQPQTISSLSFSRSFRIESHIFFLVCVSFCLLAAKKYK